MQKSERIKAEVSLRDFVDRAVNPAWDRKKSRQSKGDSWAPCPFHQEKTSSFHVVEKGGRGGFFKCFGCHKSGSVIDFAMEFWGLDFTTTVRRLAEEHGLEDELSEERRKELKRQRDDARAKADAEAEEEAAKYHRISLQIWRQCKAEARDLVSQYLAARGVRLSAIGGVPVTIRAHPNLTHREGGTPTFRGPAMVAAIGREKVLGVHRTWITAEARARHADGRKLDKQWIGRTGELFGQPCVLSPPSSAVIVGEGLETTLAAWSGLAVEGFDGWSAEAGLSRGAITGPADPAQLWTPRPGVQEILLLGEGSSKHPAEARALYEGARDRLEGLGLSVLLRVPHGRWDVDADFADVALDEIRKSKGR